MHKTPKTLLLLAALALALPSSAIAQQWVRMTDAKGNAISSTNPLPAGTTSTSLANSTSLNVSINGSAQTVNLATASNTVTVSNSTSSTIYISFSSAATSSNFPLPPGFAFSFNNLPGAMKVYLLGTSGNVGVFAH